MGEPRSTPPEARLHLVDHQQHPPFPAPLGDALEVRDVDRVDPAFTLHHLEQDGRHTAVDGLRHRIEVVERHMAEPLGQRLEDLMLVRLTGRVQRGERATVERAVGADHHVPTAAPELPGQFQGALVGLGA